MQKSQGASKAEFYSIGLMHEQTLSKRTLLGHTKWLVGLNFIVYLVYLAAKVATWPRIIMSQTLFDANCDKGISW